MPGPEKGIITRGVFSLEESLESLDDGRILLCFPHSGGFLESLESLKWTFLKRPLFQKTPFSDPKKWGEGGEVIEFLFGFSEGISWSKEHHIMRWMLSADLLDLFCSLPLTPHC